MESKKSYKDALVACAPDLQKPSTKTETKLKLIKRNRKPKPVDPSGTLHKAIASVVDNAVSPLATKLTNLPYDIIIQILEEVSIVDAISIGLSCTQLYAYYQARQYSWIKDTAILPAFVPWPENRTRAAQMRNMIISVTGLDAKPGALTQGGIVSSEELKTRGLPKDTDIGNAVGNDVHCY